MTSPDTRPALQPPVGGDIAARRAAHGGRGRFWTAAVIVVWLPLLVMLCTTLWRMPFPLSEAVAIFEDITDRSAESFLPPPSSSYYRPLFYMALSTLWNHAPSLERALDSIRLLHIVPVIALVLLFIIHVRPRCSIDAAAAMAGVAVLVGSPGFIDNLELPLSYTIVGMPAALACWVLAERERRAWHVLAITGLFLVAIGFKEQGLVIAPVILAAWIMRAPGVGRATAATVAMVAIGYVVLRLGHHGAGWPPFEQDIGLGFAGMSNTEAERRFGAFPLWIYAYNSASTFANVLFAEPSAGVFRAAHAFIIGRLEPWHVVYVGSSAVLTCLLVWWGVGAIRERRSREARVFVATMLAVAACGALSFDYSRDRLGGMAVPFYALAAFYSLRLAANRVLLLPRPLSACAAVILLLLTAAWQLRAIYAVEFTRQRAVNSHREWLTDIRERRTRFAGRPVYLRIMAEMRAQGTAPVAARPRYPRWFISTLGEY